MKTEKFTFKTAILKPKSFIFISADFFWNDHFLEFIEDLYGKTYIEKLKNLWGRFGNCLESIREVWETHWIFFYGNVYKYTNSMELNLYISGKNVLKHVLSTGTTWTFLRENV